MSQRCKVCNHPERAKIELGLAHRVPVRTLARKFGLKKEGLWRHKKNHLPPALLAALMKAGKPTTVDLEALKHAESEGLLQHLVAQRARIYVQMDKADEFGDLRAAAALQGRLTDNLTLTGKLLGDLRTASHTVVTNILISDEYTALRAALILALKPFKDARAAVSQVLREAEAKAIEAKREAPQPSA